MKLEDLKTDPASIRDNLQITGPPGMKIPSGGLTVSTRVVDSNSDVVHSEAIDQFQNAVTSARATVGGLQGTTQRIEVAADGEANCYWLPWGTGKVYMGQLGNAHEYFFTYTINGCGFIIGGTQAQPLVAHANLKSDRLNQAVKFDLKNPAAGKETADAQALIYDQFYGNLAARLIQTGDMSGTRLEIVTPQQYLIDAGAGFGAVYGVNKNKAGAWEFFGNWARQTKKLWP